MMTAMKQSILAILTMLFLLTSFAACNSGGRRGAGGSAHGTAGEAALFDTDMPESEASTAEGEAPQGQHGSELPSTRPDTEFAPEDAELSGVSTRTEDGSVENEESLRIRLTFDDNVVSVQLYDTPAGRDLLSRLPLTLEFEDYMGTEKISYLPEPLAIGEPSGTQPAGDFSYYAPWGNLAIFYNDPPPAANGLVVMGRIESGKEYLVSMAENFTMVIEPDEQKER